MMLSLVVCISQDRLSNEVVRNNHKIAVVGSRFNLLLPLFVSHGQQGIAAPYSHFRTLGSSWHFKPYSSPCRKRKKPVNLGRSQVCNYTFQTKETLITTGSWEVSLQIPVDMIINSHSCTNVPSNNLVVSTIRCINCLSLIE